MDRHDKLQDWLADDDEKVICIDGHDNAIIGVNYQDGTHLCYSVDTIVRNLVKDGMTQEEALEYHYYNIEGSKFSGNYPIYINDVRFDSDGEEQWQVERDD